MTKQAVVTCRSERQQGKYQTDKISFITSEINAEEHVDTVQMDRDTGVSVGREQQKQLYITRNYAWQY